MERERLLYVDFDERDSHRKVWRNSKKQFSRNHDLPACVSFNTNGDDLTIYWLKNNIQTRERTLPSIINFYGGKEYKKNGQCNYRIKSCVYCNGKRCSMF